MYLVLSMPFRLTFIAILSLSLITSASLCYAMENTPALFIQQESKGDLITITLYANPKHNIANAIEAHIIVSDNITTPLTLIDEKVFIQDAYFLPQDTSTSSITFRYLSLSGFTGLTKVATYTFKKEFFSSIDETYTVQLADDSLLLLADGKATNIYREK